MSSRPEIDLTLSVRSYERVLVLSNPESTYDYPESWQRPAHGNALQIDSETVVIVDRVEVSRRTLTAIGEGHPRMVAFAPLGVEQEKSIRRMLTSLYPWAEVWTTFTSFGKILYTGGVVGSPYDRETLVDMRAPTA